MDSSTRKLISGGSPSAKVRPCTVGQGKRRSVNLKNKHMVALVPVFTIRVSDRLLAVLVRHPFLRHVALARTGA